MLKKIDFDDILNLSSQEFPTLDKCLNGLVPIGDLENLDWLAYEVNGDTKSLVGCHDIAQDTVYIYFLELAVSVQKSMLGLKGYKEFFKYLEDLGYKRIITDGAMDVVPLYKKFGFQVIGESPFKLDGWDQEYRMIKYLET
jgi:hypothetical protein